MPSSLPYYEAYASNYATRAESEFPGAALQEFAALLAPGARVLDAGCGAGRDLEWLAAQGLRAEGFDGARALVALAERRLADRARVWQADFQLLSLGRDRYDGIWAYHSLSHLPPVGVQRVLQQFFAALSKGGVLGIALEEGEGERSDRVDAPDPGAPGPERVTYLYPHAEVASLIRQNGFTLLKEGRELQNPGRRLYLARRMI